MSTPEMSDKLRLFIFDHIDSVEQIEVLLFLRQHPGQAKAIGEISQELRSSIGSVEQRISSLIALGLAAREQGESDRVLYSPDSEELDQLIELLAQEYKVRRHKVLEIVFSTTKRARQFADAFMVTRGSKKGGDENDS